MTMTATAQHGAATLSRAVRMHRKYNLAIEAAARVADIPPAELALLVAVADFPDPPSITDLMGVLGRRHHTIVELLDRACIRGLVERQNRKSDQRVREIVLTGKGRQALESARAAFALPPDPLP